MNQKTIDFSKHKIVVIGDVMLDVYLMGEVKRLSPEAPVPIVKIIEKTNTLGGAGNVSLNLAGLGCRTSLFGIRGNDPAGERISEILRENDIGDNLIIDENQLTTSKTRIIGQGQQLLRMDEEEIWMNSDGICSYMLSNIKKELHDANAVILSDYNKGVICEKLSQPIIHYCRKRQIPVLVDPKRTAWELYQGATGVTPNTSELIEVAGGRTVDTEFELSEVARSIKERYQLDWLVVTRGPDGMCLIGDDGDAVFIKATAREVFDVSGAGDSVIATITACIASGLPITVATKVANIAAGIVVGKLGSQPIDLSELKAVLRFSEIGSVDYDMKKISSPGTALLQVKAWKAINEKVVFVYGCFDLFHPGHKHILRCAKELGDRLVVGLKTDDLVRRIKGAARPILTEKDRAYILTFLFSVDLVVRMGDESPKELINMLRPDILLTASDSILDDMTICKSVEAYGGKIRQIPYLEGYSTSKILEEYIKRVNGSD